MNADRRWNRWVHVSAWVVRMRMDRRETGVMARNYRATEMVSGSVTGEMKK